MQTVRSWMFVPGNRQKMITKALGLKPDAVILDLEDGVPPAEKETARNLVAAAVGRPPGGPVRFVRTQPAGSAGMRADLSAVIRPGLAGLVLPKVEQPEDVLLAHEILEEQEARAGVRPGSVRLLASIESARGLVRAPAIAGSCARLVGLFFGAEDFAQDLGLLAVRGTEAGELLYARSAVVVAAASERLQAVDRVYPDILDQDGLAEDARRASALGFTGKAVIHPGQIETVHRAFRPAVEEVEYARRVVEAFEEAETAGEGAVAVDGRMIDLPVVERARRVLELHQMAG